MAQGIKKDPDRIVDICSNPTCSKLGTEQLIEAFSWLNKSEGRYQTRCKTCRSATEKQRRLENPEKARASVKKWELMNPDKKKANAEKWNRNNIEYRRFLRRKWAKNNPQKVRAGIIKRKIAKLKRIPPWSEKEAIKQFIINCPLGMVVDHKIPLRGKLVSGLHVLNNLQYLTPKENGSKGNKFDPIKFNNLDKK
jgi:hypothetical protein